MGGSGERTWRTGGWRAVAIALIVTGSLLLGGVVPALVGAEEGAQGRTPGEVTRAPSTMTAVAGPGDGSGLNPGDRDNSTSTGQQPCQGKVGDPACGSGPGTGSGQPQGGQNDPPVSTQSVQVIVAFSKVWQGTPPSGAIDDLLVITDENDVQLATCDWDGAQLSCTPNPLVLPAGSIYVVQENLPPGWVAVSGTGSFTLSDAELEKRCTFIGTGFDGVSRWVCPHTVANGREGAEGKYVIQLLKGWIGAGAPASHSGLVEVTVGNQTILCDWNGDNPLSCSDDILLGPGDSLYVQEPNLPLGWVTLGGTGTVTFEDLRGRGWCQDPSPPFLPFGFCFHGIVNARADSDLHIPVTVTKAWLGGTPPTDPIEGLVLVQSGADSVTCDWNGQALVDPSTGAECRFELPIAQTFTVTEQNTPWGWTPHPPTLGDFTLYDLAVSGTCTGSDWENLTDVECTHQVTNRQLEVGVFFLKRWQGTPPSAPIDQLLVVTDGDGNELATCRYDPDLYVDWLDAWATICSEEDEGAVVLDPGATYVVQENLPGGWIAVSGLGTYTLSPDVVEEQCQLVDDGKGWYCLHFVENRAVSSGGGGSGGGTPGDGGSGGGGTLPGGQGGGTNGDRSSPVGSPAGQESSPIGAPDEPFAGPPAAAPGADPVSDVQQRVSAVQVMPRTGAFSWRTIDLLLVGSVLFVAAGCLLLLFSPGRRATQ